MSTKFTNWVKLLIDELVIDPVVKSGKCYIDKEFIEIQKGYGNCVF